MKRYVIAICVGLLTAFAAPAQDKKRQVMAVAFYNLENFFNPEDDPKKSDEDFTPGGSHRYTEAIFRQKAHNMATVLAAMAKAYCPEGPALIGICEVEDDRALKELVRQPEISDRKYRFIRFDGPDERGINVGLLYRPDCFKVTEARAIPVNLKYAGGGKTRDILFVKGLLSGDLVYVLVNHWPSRSGGEAVTAPKRAAAAAAVRQAVDQVLAREPDARILIMGDLNDDPVSPSVAEVLQATGDLKELSGNHLYNPWMRFYRQGLGTLCHNDHWNLFDQILLSPAWLKGDTGRWRYDRAQVFDDDFLKTVRGKYRGYPHRSYSGTRWINGYSDHFPTIIYLLKER